MAHLRKVTNATPAHPGAEKPDRRTRIKMATDEARLFDVENQRLSGVKVSGTVYTGLVELIAGDHIRLTPVTTAAGIHLRIDWIE